jgi:hypothetical protein
MPIASGIVSRRGRSLLLSPDGWTEKETGDAFASQRDGAKAIRQLTGTREHAVAGRAPVPSGGTDSLPVCQLRGAPDRTG